MYWTTFKIDMKINKQFQTYAFCFLLGLIGIKFLIDKVPLCSMLEIGDFG
jgi:hypothetical protein